MSVNNILTYSSSECSDESDLDDVPEPKLKKPRLIREWIIADTFQTAKEAENAVEDEKIWKKASAKEMQSGRRVEYRCSLAPYRRNECPSGLYLLYHSDNHKVSLYRTSCEHANHATYPSRGLSDEIKSFVRKKFEEGLRKPNAVLYAMRIKGITEPPKAKLENYLKVLRYEKYGNPTISVNELREWCVSHNSKPDNLDDPFVLAYNITAESREPEDQCLKVIITTPRLLDIMNKSEMVQIDATYKLVWQGYPVMVVGTSDATKVFHPFAIAVCNGESAEDFAFVFKSLSDYNPEWKPNILLADASEAITAGFRMVFGEPKVRLMCYFHVLKNIEKYLKPLSKNGVSGAIKQDIDVLQTCSNMQLFSIASRLFVAKWKAFDGRTAEFCEYFEHQWLVSKNLAWFEGAALGYPSTNNGIESTNACIKREHTLRERLPVGQFLRGIFDLVSRWSTSRDPTSVNCVPFSSEVAISLPIWTKSYQWAVKNVPIVEDSCTSEGQLFFVASSSAKKPISDRIVARYKRKYEGWKTFDEMKNELFSVWAISVKEDVRQSNCTCPFFAKNKLCKHTLGMQIRLQKVSVPVEAKNVPLGQKRKRGRPSKAKKALLI